MLRGPCLGCYQQLSIEFIPNCQNCGKKCKRVCGFCQPSVFRICTECLYTSCVECDDPCDSNDYMTFGTKGFVFPKCSLPICYEHNGRLEFLRHMTVCKEGCREYLKNSCYNCGFWVCPRTRECHYEMGVLKSINRIVKSCSNCKYGSCGLCKDLSSKCCIECKTKCFYCLGKGVQCLDCSSWICGSCHTDSMHRCY